MFNQDEFKKTLGTVYTGEEQTWEMPTVSNPNTNTLAGLFGILGDTLNKQLEFNKELYGNLNNQSPINTYVGNFAKIATGLNSLAGMFLGFKNYQLAKKQVSLANEQWQRTKEELDRIRKVRNKLTAKYMSKTEI